MATEENRVGIIGANVCSGWGRDAHIPALRALPEFEITAVTMSRQETADETAKHFAIPHAFADPYEMVQHPDVDLVSICVRVPFHHQLGMAALMPAKVSTANGRLRPPLTAHNHPNLYATEKGDR